MQELQEPSVRLAWEKGECPLPWQDTDALGSEVDGIGGLVCPLHWVKFVPRVSVLCVLSWEWRSGVWTGSVAHGSPQAHLIHKQVPLFGAESGVLVWWHFKWLFIWIILSGFLVKEEFLPIVFTLLIPTRWNNDTFPEKSRGKFPSFFYTRKYMFTSLVNMCESEFELMNAG